MVIVTKELIENGSTLAERAIRDDLARAVVDALDAAFLDPLNAGLAGVRPASVTSGVTPVTATLDLKSDLSALFGGFAGDLALAHFIGHPATLAGLTSADYPAIGARGGELSGVPAIASRNAPIGNLILIDPQGIALAEGEARAVTSEHASVEMLDNPTNNSATATATQVVSLWQTGAVALGVSRQINWTMIRPGAVAILDLAVSA